MLAALIFDCGSLLFSLIYVMLIVLFSLLFLISCGFVWLIDLLLWLCFVLCLLPNAGSLGGLAV